jgi:septal ring factor EnvC (AmiA/AmiB activator)
MPQMQMPMMAAQRTSGMAIAGFVLSFFCGLLGLIFSIMGRNECKRSNGSVGGAGLALAGIIISILHLIATVIYALLVAVLFSHGMEQAKATMERTDQTIRKLDESNAKLEAAMHELDAIQQQVTDAEQAVTNASSEAERDAANARVSDLQQKLTAAQQRMSDAVDAAGTAAGVKIDKRCVDNPLAPGC